MPFSSSMSSTRFSHNIPGSECKHEFLVPSLVFDSTRTLSHHYIRINCSIYACISLYILNETTYSTKTAGILKTESRENVAVRLWSHLSER